MVIPVYPGAFQLVEVSTLDREELVLTSWNKIITDEQIRIFEIALVIPELSPDMDLPCMGEWVLDAPFHIYLRAAAVVTWTHGHCRAGDNVISGVSR